MRSILYFVFLLSIPNFAQTDSLVLKESTFWWLISNNHPIAKQADLLEQKGSLEVKKAKGQFDPLIAINHNAKTFDEKDYFGLLEGGLVIPTTYGIDLKANYSRNDGVFLNPENKVPDKGLWSAGVAIPIGQGLFFDERRATLKKAKIFAQSTIVQREMLLNELYYGALTSYYYWINAWQQKIVYEQAVDLAEERLTGIRQRFIEGDLPAIDTLEAFIQLQNRIINFQEYELELNNARLNLSNFLWTEEQIPLLMSDSLSPPANPTLQIDEFSTNIEIQDAQSNPALLLYDLKLKELEVEQRWKKEKIKPKAKIAYNFLNPTQDFNLFRNNYKWGIEFSMPLFLRTARNDLKLGKIKIQETSFEQKIKMQEIKNKNKMLLNKFRTLRNQIDLLNSNVKDYRSLLEAEQFKFQIGESSVFLLNSRELKLIELQIKLVKKILKRRLAYLEYRRVNVSLNELNF